MKIIFIHGMNQQNYTAHRLKEHWLKVFKLGLKQLHCRVNLRDLHIHMPFYGDLMTKYQLSNQLDLNTLLPKLLTFIYPSIYIINHQPQGTYSFYTPPSSFTRSTRTKLIRAFIFNFTVGERSRS